nr:hypothetical protein CFP56_73931 [Quercus suber]
MGFFDLNIAYLESSPSDKTPVKTTCIKVVMKSHRTRLHWHRLQPYDQRRATAPPGDNVAPPLLALNSGNPILKTYDLVAVKPLDQNAFDDACDKSEMLSRMSKQGRQMITNAKDSYSQCFKEKTILQGCNIVEAISSVIDSMTSHGFQVKALISQTGAMLQPPDNGKISFSAAEIVYVPAAASGLPEQCESVDLPKSDQTFVFDTPLIHQASGCENSQNLYSPNDAAGALTNYEEIITPNHLQSRKGESKWALTRDSELDVACDADAKRELLTQFEDIGLPASPNEESEKHFSKREQFRDAGNDAAILADCLPTPESHNIDDFSIANHESIELTMEQRDGEADTRVHNPTCSQSISGKSRLKRTSHRTFFFFPFKRLLNRVSFKKRTLRKIKSGIKML